MAELTKPWADMTPSERSAHMTAKKTERREKKQREIAEQTRSRLLAERSKDVIEDADLTDEPESFPLEAVVGRVEEPEAAPAPREVTPFDLFLAKLDRETREVLDEDELREIFAEQQVKAKEQKRAALKKAAADKALTAARIAEGVVTPKLAAEIAWHERMNELVDFRLELPTTGGIATPGVEVGPIDIGLRIDQKVFLDGQTHTLTRAQYDSMRDIVYRAQQAELRFEGKGKGNWLARRALGSVERHVA